MPTPDSLTVTVTASDIGPDWKRTTPNTADVRFLAPDRTVYVDVTRVSTVSGEAYTCGLYERESPHARYATQQGSRITTDKADIPAVVSALATEHSS